MPYVTIPRSDVNGKIIHYERVFEPNAQEAREMADKIGIAAAGIGEISKDVGMFSLYTAAAGLEQYMNFCDSFANLLVRGEWKTIPTNQSWKQIAG